MTDLNQKQPTKRRRLSLTTYNDSIGEVRLVGFTRDATTGSQSVLDVIEVSGDTGTLSSALSLLSQKDCYKIEIQKL